MYSNSCWILGLKSHTYTSTLILTKYQSLTINSTFWHIFAIIYLPRTWIMKDANTTNQPQPPSGGFCISLTLEAEMVESSSPIFTITQNWKIIQQYQYKTNVSFMTKNQIRNVFVLILIFVLVTIKKKKKPLGTWPLFFRIAEKTKK